MADAGARRRSRPRFDVATWVSYISLQGSEPGRIIPGKELLPSRMESASADHTIAVSIDVAGERDEAPATSIGPEHGLEAPKAGRNRKSPRPPVSTLSLDEEEGGLHDVTIHPSSGAPHAHAHPSAAPSAVEHSRLLDLAGMDADPDFDLSLAPDLTVAKAEANAAAQRGERVCKYCAARQPARAHHCRHCDTCVHTFDHHCTVLNTCIGERNRCRFWAFLFTQTLTLAFAIGILNTGFVWRRNTSDWVGANVLALIALIALWIIQLLVFGMFVFHTWLACTNTTTFESVTGAPRLWYLAGTNPKECDLPYSHGLCGNLKQFCCILDTASVRWGCGRMRRDWLPAQWSYPGTFDRTSEDVLHNLWENRFWSCC